MAKGGRESKMPGYGQLLIIPFPIAGIWIICTLIIEHLGIVSGEQTRSLRSLSRISQAKIDGHSALYLESMPSVSFYPPAYILLMSKLPNFILTNLSTRCTTEFVATLGFDPPIAFGRIDPVS